MEEMIKEIYILLGFYVVLVNEEGEIIKRCLDNKITIESSNRKNYLKQSINIYLNSLQEIKSNIKLSQLYVENNDTDNIDLNSYNCIIIPIYITKERKGSLIFYKQNYKFLEEDINILEIFSLFISFILGNKSNEHKIEEVRKKEIVKSAIDILSYSELESILYIFDELKNTEGIIITSKVADKMDVAKSVIVNGLRKLESAGIIESRSLGMKGTFIKILNNELIIELNKIKN